MHLVVVCVMEGSMVFCQKNIVEHSMGLHADNIKKCLLAHKVNQILYLTKLISEIKYISANGLFSTNRLGASLGQAPSNIDIISG
jgi:hypothetical protein